MDVDLALVQLRAALKSLEEHACSFCWVDISPAVEAFNALDDWLSDGGFKPVEWST